MPLFPHMIVEQNIYLCTDRACRDDERKSCSLLSLDLSRSMPEQTKQVERRRAATSIFGTSPLQSEPQLLCGPCQPLMQAEKNTCVRRSEGFMTRRHLTVLCHTTKKKPFSFQTYNRHACRRSCKRKVRESITKPAAVVGEGTYSPYSIIPRQW